MRWQILDELSEKDFKDDDVLAILLKNRGLKTKKEIDEFLSPLSPDKLTASDLGIEAKEVKKAVKRIDRAIKNNESIIVYGDYDADGICATAILWKTLYKLTKNVLPYIPERVNEGYGLNKNSVKNLKLKIKNLGLIITVDHGIVASDKIKYAQSLGIDIIVCDHHQPGKKLPVCSALVVTDKICAAAIAWFLAGKIQNDLDLVAIATIADLEPLVGVNRSFAKFGLKALNETKKCGLLAILAEAGIKPGNIGTYEVGYLIGPRLNAMGRIEHALESLRLLCTEKCEKAKELAVKLGATNKERQLLTEETVKHALENTRMPKAKLIFIGHKSYNQGVIGLVAGRLVEKYYRPAVVLSIGEVYSKASARSISGFNIIEAIRAQSDLLIDAGGHPMAAGFTVETVKIELLKKKLEEAAEAQIPLELLEKSLKIDLALPLSAVTPALWEEIQKMSPFGLGNPEPVFTGTAVIKDFRLVGSEGKHLKLTLKDGQKTLQAIGFGLGRLADNLKPGQEVSVAYTLSLNEWNGSRNLEIKIKDLVWKSSNT